MIADGGMLVNTKKRFPDDETAKSRASCLPDLVAVFRRRGLGRSRRRQAGGSVGRQGVCRVWRGLVARREDVLEDGGGDAAPRCRAEAKPDRRVERRLRACGRLRKQGTILLEVIDKSIHIM